VAITGLDIYKGLPKTNCKECGFPTCLAFAMQVAAKKVGLDKCPYVSDELKASTSEASAPPIRLVKIGTGDAAFEVGNETVLFRHDKRFFNETGVGFMIDDSLDDAAVDAEMTAARNLVLERVGLSMKPNLVAVRDSGAGAERFAAVARKVADAGVVVPMLVSRDQEKIGKALDAMAASRPLVHCADSENWQAMAELAKKHSVPLAVYAETLDDLAGLAANVAKAGVQDLLLDTGPKRMSRKLWELTQIRRLAVNKRFRPFGYPVVVFTTSDDAYYEPIEAAGYILKYAGVVITKGHEHWQMMATLSTRQNIYTDPQVPTQVKPDIYAVGAAGESSPVLITTNFSITYYTVETEVEASRTPCWLIAADAEGMSVLTAWAADKFTVETIAKTLETSGIEQKVNHKTLVIPGYVAVLSGKLEDESGWKVVVGPREASSIVQFLREFDVTAA